MDKSLTYVKSGLQKGMSGGLLVADTYEPIHRLFKRCFLPQFEEIFTADNENDAEDMIRSGRISHVVISSRIAESAPLDELVARWRSKYPSIQRVILHTGRAIATLPALSEFDAILAKPCTKKTMEQVVIGFQNEMGASESGEDNSPTA